MTKDECFALVSSIDPSARRIPAGLYEMANAIEVRLRAELQPAAAPVGVDAEVWQRGYEYGVDDAKAWQVEAEAHAGPLVRMASRIERWWRA